MKKYPAWLAGALALLTAGTLLTGCSKGTGQKELKDCRATEPIQTVLHEGSMGEPVEIDDVSVTLDAVYSSDLLYKDLDEDTTIVFFKLTITNNTSDSMSFQYITNYSILVDGEVAPSISARALMSISKQFGEDAERFETPFEPGETRTGYVAMEIRTNFKEISFRTTPLAGSGNQEDVIDYTYQRNELTPAPDSAAE